MSGLNKYVKQEMENFDYITQKTYLKYVENKKGLHFCFVFL